MFSSSLFIQAALTALFGLAPLAGNGGPWRAVQLVLALAAVGVGIYLRSAGSEAKAVLVGFEAVAVAIGVIAFLGAHTYVPGTIIAIGVLIRAANAQPQVAPAPWPPATAQPPAGYPTPNQYGWGQPQNYPQAPQYGQPQYGQQQYGAPAPQYGAPVPPQYGTPAPQYGAPVPPQYGTPAPQYGAPVPPQYGTPAPQYGTPVPPPAPASDAPSGYPPASAAPGATDSAGNDAQGHAD